MVETNRRIKTRVPCAAAGRGSERARVVTGTLVKEALAAYVRRRSTGQVFESCDNLL